MLRVVLAMTRFQRSRERYRRRKMLGLTAPVTRVIELISELRQKVQREEDDRQLAWTAEIIAKEELYKANVHTNSAGRLTVEMVDWMRSNLQVTSQQQTLPLVHGLYTWLARFAYPLAFD